MRCAWLLTLGLLGIGCVDPGEEYQAFIDRQSSAGEDAGIPPPPDDDGGVLADAGTCTPSTVAGEYRLALSVTIAPETPILADVTLAGSDEPPTFALSVIQPLSAADRTTPVGPSFSAGPFDVVGGAVALAVPGLDVVGAANPITGSDISADVVLHLEPCAPRLCGPVSGRVTAPIDLDLEGSTFTMTPIDDVTEPPPIDCRGTRAAPL